MSYERVRGVADVEVMALATIYAADRGDQAATVNNAVALLGAGIAYATATLAFFDQIAATLSRPLVALLPFPLWMVVLYHALLTGVSMSRAASIRMVERELLARTGLSPDSGVGYGAVEQVLNVFHARWPHRIASVITYAGTGVITVGYTAYVLIQDPRLRDSLGVSAAAGYALVAALWVWCWVSALGRYRLQSGRSS